MAHVHNEYLEEIDDQNNVQMEMVVETTEPDTSVLSDPVDNTKGESSENEKTANHPEVKIEKKLIGQILVSNIIYVRIENNVQFKTLEIDLNYN